MSHKATYWLATVDPKAVSAGAFRVLFHLCDYHNDERDPERACFPSQERLREKTGLSNGGLNKCLQALEEAGLLARKRSTQPGSAARRTYYILGCDMDQTTELTPQSGDSPGGRNDELTPLLEGANSTFGPSKLHSSGEDPKKEPVSNPPKGARATFSEFWGKWPDSAGKLAAEKAWKKLSEQDRSSALRSAEAFFDRWRADHPSATLMHGSTYLNQKRWTDYEDVSAPASEDRQAMIADMLKSRSPAVRAAAERMKEAAQ